MRKFFRFAIAATAVCLMAACGSKNANATESENKEEATEQVEQTEKKEQPAEAEKPAAPEKPAVNVTQEPGQKGFIRYTYPDIGISVEIPENCQMDEKDSYKFVEKDQTYKTMYFVKFQDFHSYPLEEYMKTRGEGSTHTNKDAKWKVNGNVLDLEYTQNTTITHKEHHVYNDGKAYVVKIIYWNTNRDDKPEQYYPAVIKSIKIDK